MTPESRAASHVPRVTCHESRATSHVPRVTCHVEIASSAACASRPSGRSHVPDAQGAVLQEQCRIVQRTEGSILQEQCCLASAALARQALWGTRVCSTSAVALRQGECSPAGAVRVQHQCRSPSAPEWPEPIRVSIRVSQYPSGRSPSESPMLARSPLAATGPAPASRHVARHPAPRLPPPHGIWPAASPPQSRQLPSRLDRAGPGPAGGVFRPTPWSCTCARGVHVTVTVIHVERAREETNLLMALHAAVAREK